MYHPKKTWLRYVTVKKRRFNINESRIGNIWNDPPGVIVHYWDGFLAFTIFTTCLIKCPFNTRHTPESLCKEVTARVQTCGRFKPVPNNFSNGNTRNRWKIDPLVNLDSRKEACVIFVSHVPWNHYRCSISPSIYCVDTNMLCALCRWFSGPHSWVPPFHASQRILSIEGQGISALTESMEWIDLRENSANSGNHDHVGITIINHPQNAPNHHR